MEEYLKENGINLEESLNLLGDIDTYKSIMLDFLESSQNRLNRIKKYHETKELNNYEIEVHSLKSDSKYLGFDKLSNLALSHETACKNNDYNTIDLTFDEFIKEFERIIGICKTCLKESKDESVEVIENDIELDNRKIILIADDSNIIRDFIKESFGDEYKLVGVENGKNAENIINKYEDRIACLLLDINMPEVDGFRVLEWLNENNLFIKIPVSIITGLNDKETIEKAFNYPIISMLNKPFNKSDVKEVIIKMINKE